MEPLIVAPVDGSLHQICICPIGYSGLTCSELSHNLEPCHHYEDNHVCRNGGVCRPDNFAYELGDTVEWRCDCNYADDVNSFAGAMCRDPATEYCSKDGSKYCTNGGSCVNNIIHAHDYEGSDNCICPPEFKGPHCEFLAALVNKHSGPQFGALDVGLSIGNKIRPETKEGGTGMELGLAVGLSIFVLAGILLLVKKNRMHRRYGARTQIPTSVGNEARFPVLANHLHADDDDVYELRDVVIS